MYSIKKGKPKKGRSYYIIKDGEEVYFQCEGDIYLQVFETKEIATEVCNQLNIES